MSQKKIKILHLIKSLGRGGAEMLLPETLQYHDRARFDFEYAYFLPWKDQMVSSLTSKQANVTCFNRSNSAAMLLAVPEIVCYVREFGVDIIHCHLPWAGIVGRLAGKLAGVPVIYTEHNSQERYHPVTRWINLLTMRMEKATICVSDDVRHSIRRFKGAGFPLSVILNGIDTSKFDRHHFQNRNVLSTAGIPLEARVVTTVAVFRSQKRLHIWLDVAAAVARQQPDVHFVLIGDGPLSKEIKAKATALGIADKTHFPGRLEEVRPWLGASDVYLMTSEFEGLPLALLEAMSMELPVVSTDAGGIKEVLRDGIDGYLRPVSGTQELIEPLLSLLANKTFRLDVGRAARQRVCDNFSIKKMVGELENIYLKIGNEH